MEKIRLTEAQFLDVLKNIKSCQIVNVISNTEAKMNKRNNPYYGRVRKVSEGLMQFNFSYENAVNNRLEKQGDSRSFQSNGLPNGQEWVKGMENKATFKGDTTYIRLYGLKNAKTSVSYLLDGVTMEGEELEEMKSFLVKSSPSARQSAEGLNENQVICRSYKLESIVEMSIDNKCIVIER